MHAFADGRLLILGGVEIPSERGLAGHSDADVLTHAVIDALLGAAAMGDIGSWFPSSDQRFAGADSLVLLDQVVGRLCAGGWTIVNVDATLVLQAPRVAPYVVSMRRRLADALCISQERVGVKATTTDHLGALGRGEGAAAHAVALLLAPA